MCKRVTRLSIILSYDFINNNKFLIDLIETYCAINNIETINYNIEENEIYFIDDTLAIYLQEIKNYPLLSIQEEKDFYSILQK